MTAYERLNAEQLREYERVAGFDEAMRFVVEWEEDISLAERILKKADRRQRIFRAIVEERTRQTEKWGGQWERGRVSPETKLAILTEEVGGVAREILDAPKDGEWPEESRARLSEELVQIAAVSVAWLESMGGEKD